jgi:proton-coupled amino acid transporter
MAGDHREALLEQAEAHRRGGCGPSGAQSHAFANLLKTMIGSGILTLPWATSRAGLVLSLLGLLYLAYLSQAAIRLTVRCVAFTPSQRKTLVSELRHTGSLRNTRRSTRNSSRRSTERDSIGDGIAHVPRVGSGVPASPSAINDALRKSVVADGHGCGSWQIISTAAYGEPARVVTILMLTLAQFCASVSYFDFVADSMITLLGFSKLAAVFSLWAFLCVLSLLKQLKSVAWLSAAALLTYIFVLVLLADFGADQLEHEHEHPRRFDNSTFPSLASPAGLGAWFGPALFAFEGMGTALSIYEAMEDADPRPYFSVVSATYVISYVLYGAVGAFGYMAWGSDVARVVIDGFPAFNTTAGAFNTTAQEFSLAAHLALSVILALSFVLQMTPVFHVFEDLLHSEENRRLPASLWPLTRAVLVGLVALTGALVPDMEVMVSLTGSVALSSIGFVLPGIFFLKLQPPASPTEGLTFRLTGGDGDEITTHTAGHSCAAARCREQWDNFISVLLILTGVIGGGFGVAAVFFPSAFGA